MRRFPKAPGHLASRSLLNSSENILKYKKYLFEFRAWASGRRVGIDSRNSNLTDPRVMRSSLTYCLVNRPVIMRIDRFHVAIIRELPSILVAFAIVAMVSRLGIDFKMSRTYPDYLFGYVAVHMILGIFAYSFFRSIFSRIQSLVALAVTSLVVYYISEIKRGYLGEPLIFNDLTNTENSSVVLSIWAFLMSLSLRL